MTETRDRILDTTAELFRRYGDTGVGMKHIVAGPHRPAAAVPAAQVALAGA